MDYKTEGFTGLEEGLAPELNTTTYNFHSPEEVWTALAHAASGAERKAVLYSKNEDGTKHRDFVRNSGANVQFYTEECNDKKRYQDSKTHKDPLDLLADIELLVVKRLRKGTHDGIGAIGGLSERSTLAAVKHMHDITTEAEDIQAQLDMINDETADIGAAAGFHGIADVLEDREERLMESERHISPKDDIVFDKHNRPSITNNINKIRINTVCREVDEELGEFLPTGTAYEALTEHQKAVLGFKMDTQKLDEARPLTDNVQDDNYIINIWKPDPENPLKNPAYAVTPYNHIYHLDKNTFDAFADVCSEEKTTGEVAKLESLPLVEALKRFGKPSVDSPTKNPDDPAFARDMEHDFRYVHEWITTWNIANKKLHYSDKKMQLLAAEVQRDIGAEYKIDFRKAAQDMGISFDALANVIGVNEPSDHTLTHMQAQIDVAYEKACEMPANNIANHTVARSHSTERTTIL